MAARHTSLRRAERSVVARKAKQRRAREDERHRERSEQGLRRSTIFAQWGTFIAGVATAVGLVFVAVGTYLTAAALEDQRDQQHQQEQQDRRAQATQVAAWQDNSGNFFIENRSLDPLYSIGIELDFGNRLVDYFRLLESFPPCTRLQITRDDIMDNLHGDSEGWISMESISFYDAEGEAWKSEMKPPGLEKDDEIVPIWLRVMPNSNIGEEADSSLDALHSPSFTTISSGDCQ
jgi:hypothetical protein